MADPLEPLLQMSKPNNFEAKIWALFRRDFGDCTWCYAVFMPLYSIGFEFEASFFC